MRPTPPARCRWPARWSRRYLRKGLRRHLHSGPVVVPIAGYLTTGSRRLKVHGGGLAARGILGGGARRRRCSTFEMTLLNTPGAGLNTDEKVKACRMAMA